MCFSKGAGGATSPSGSGISAFLISCTKYPGGRRKTESERKLHRPHFLECCRVDLQLLLMVLITLQHRALAVSFIHSFILATMHTQRSLQKRGTQRVVRIKHKNYSCLGSLQRQANFRASLSQQVFSKKLFPFHRTPLLLHSATFC